MKPVSTFQPEMRERYVVNLVCPSRTLGLELAYSKRGPFIVNPIDAPATLSEMKAGDALVGIDNWFFDKKTSLDKVLNEVRKKMKSDQPMIRLILEREQKSPTLPETQEDAFDEKVSDVPEDNEPIPAVTETPKTSQVSQEQGLLDVGVEKKENIPDTSLPIESEPAVNSNETKELRAPMGASEPNQDGGNVSTVTDNELKESEVRQDERE